MLISGVLSFDPQGRIIASALPPLDFNGGTPIAADGGLAAAPGADPDLLLAAIGYLDAGNITDSDNPLVGDGPLTNPSGQLRISNGLPAYWYAGLPLTSEGYLSISPGAPPPDLGEYDNGFDAAFDIGD